MRARTASKVFAFCPLPPESAWELLMLVTETELGSESEEVKQEER